MAAFASTAMHPQAWKALGRVDRWTPVERTFVLDQRSPRRLASLGIPGFPSPPDLEPLNQTKRISGRILTAAGDPFLGGASVLLFRTDDEEFLARTTSSTVDGTYVFPRNAADNGSYFVVAFANTTSPPLQAVTVRGLRPA